MMSISLILSVSSLCLATKRITILSRVVQNLLFERFFSILIGPMKKEELF